MTPLALLAQAGAQTAEIVEQAGEAAAPAVSTTSSVMFGITVFVLAIFVGVEIITKIPATLHTPLMSGSNAISGITIVGAILALGAREIDLAGFLGFVAVILAMINVVGGFLVTHRMLEKFRR